MQKYPKNASTFSPNRYDWRRTKTRKNATVLCFLQDFYKKSAPPPQPVLNKLTAGGTGCIICNMKKVFIGFIFISILTVAGCGVKSDLARPDPSFPRDYPVY